MYDLFNVLLDSDCQNFVKDFCIYVHQWPVVFFLSFFLFFVASLSGFAIRVMVASQNELGSLPSSAIFWKSLSRIGISSSVNFWQNLAVKPSCPGLLFVGRFLITSFYAYDGSISSWFSFGKLYFSKNLFISSKLSILLANSC